MRDISFKREWIPTRTKIYIRFYIVRIIQNSRNGFKATKTREKDSKYMKLVTFAPKKPHKNNVFVAYEIDDDIIFLFCLSKYNFYLKGIWNVKNKC